MTKELSNEQFKSMFNEKMSDVTQTAEPIIDIWEYVAELVKENKVNQYVLENYLVEKVYRNSSMTFDQVLLPTNNSNAFTVIIVDITKRQIFGHYLLDLENEYGQS